LDRDIARVFDTKSSAFDELVANLVAGRLGLLSDPLKEHAAYIAAWLKVLKNDFRIRSLYLQIFRFLHLSS
jgi:antirestriction protein ArdC